MDIFNEIKEAVLSATPGEDTRNYYRNQGIATERERIIKLLEAWLEDDDADFGDTLALIKGEQK